MEIQFKVDSVLVTSDEVEILRLNQFPVSDLKHQLRAWLDSVSDEKAEVFVYKSTDSNYTGIFRIEPRPKGWQFTSFREQHRSTELLSLDEWRGLLDVYD